LGERSEKFRYYFTDLPPIIFKIECMVGLVVKCVVAHGSRGLWFFLESNNIGIGVFIMTKFIEKINFQRFNHLVSSAKQHIYISLPNIHEEYANALLEAKSTVDDIRVTLDISENIFRNGYGDIDAIGKLQKKGIDIYESPKNRVSFLICDDNAYFIFPESRIFVSEDIGDNAVKMDPVTKFHLITYYFPSDENEISTNTEIDRPVDRREAITDIVKKEADKYADFVKETIDDMVKPEDKPNVVPLDSNNLDFVKGKLKENPPKHPDLQRQIQTYTAKIQFVELNFKGSNLHIKKVTLPQQAMPFRDEEIKKVLETKMRLFSDLTSNTNFKDFFELKNEVDEVRKKYCVPIKSRKKNVVKVSEKESFKVEIEKFQQRISDLNEIIPQSLDREILNSKKRMQEELEKFLEKNPPDEIKNYDSDLLKDKVKDIVSKIVSNIRYPEPQKIISTIDLSVNFYDLTFEDFKNDNFLKELKKQNIMKDGEIEDIVSLCEAFKAK